MIIQVSLFDQFAPRCRFAIFVAALTFPPNVKDLVCSNEQGAFT